MSDYFGESWEFILNDTTFLMIMKDNSRELKNIDTGETLSVLESSIHVNSGAKQITHTYGGVVQYSSSAKHKRGANTEFGPKKVTSKKTMKDYLMFTGTNEFKVIDCKCNIVLKINTYNTEPTLFCLADGNYCILVDKELQFYDCDFKPLSKCSAPPSIDTSSFVYNHMREGNVFLDYTTGIRHDNIVVKKYKNVEIVAEIGINGIQHKLRKIVFSESDCAVCFNQIATRYAMVPCGHTNVCDKCLKTVNKCPICNVGITSNIKLFL